jgi:hypothetical protein
MRARALLRFLNDLAATTRKDLSELFHEMRYAIRFQDSLNVTADDAAALEADGPADQLMIEAVGCCVIGYGFTILRALCIWRELGGDCARRLGLYAILRSTTLKNQFTSLVHLHHSELDVYAGKQVIATSALRTRQVESNALLAWIKDENEVRLFEADSIFTTSARYCDKHWALWEKHVEEDEKLIFSAGRRVHSTVLFARLLMQASRHSLKDTKEFDWPQKIVQPRMSGYDQFARTESSDDPAYKSSGFVEIQIADDQSEEWDQVLTNALEYDGLQQATREIGDAIARGADIRSGNNNELIRKILESSSFVARMYFIAACSFHINVRKSDSRSDSRVAVMGQVVCLRELYVDLLIELFK